MDNESFFETYLYLSPKKFIISVIQINDLKLIHKIELLIENDSNTINFEKLTDFLDDNILKLEKVLNHFIKDISVILKSEDFIPIYLSVKNNNNGNVLTYDNLSFLLKSIETKTPSRVGLCSSITSTARLSPAPMSCFKSFRKSQWESSGI